MVERVGQCPNTHCHSEGPRSHGAVKKPDTKAHYGSIQRCDPHRENRHRQAQRCPGGGRGSGHTAAAGQRVGMGSEDHTGTCLMPLSR